MKEAKNGSQAILGKKQDEFRHGLGRSRWERCSFAKNERGNVYVHCNIIIYLEKRIYVRK